MTDAFETDLRVALAEALDDATLTLAAVHRRGEGYSWETYLVTTGRGQRFAVKREPLAGLLGTYDVALEVDLLRAAKSLGCPVPEVIAHRIRPAHRDFYVMEMVAGVVPMPWDVHKVLPDAEVRHRIGLELAAIMGKLHSADVRELRIRDFVPPKNPMTLGLAEVDKWRAVYLECAAVRMPVLDLAFSWLAAHAGAVSGRVSLVHNDLRVGNVVVADGAVAAVLDWETALFSDPAADLAKFNLPTFRGRSGLASGLVPWADFLDAYERVAGWRPTEKALNYWTVLEIAKTVVGSLRGLAYFENGTTNDLRYASFGRQTHHLVRWLVELFDAGVWGRA